MDMDETKSGISEALGEIKDLDQEKKELESPTTSDFEHRIVKLLVSVIKELVDKEDQIEVKAVVGAQTTVFEVTVAKSDIGKLIGKQGKTAAALRKLAWCWASKYKKRCAIEIVE